MPADSRRFAPAESLRLVTGASHHFVSTSLASQPSLLRGEGSPFVEIHPVDAAARGRRMMKSGRSESHHQAA